MAAESPILLNLSNAVFLQQAETGGILVSYSRKTQSELIKVYDGSVGATTGLVFHDFNGGYDVKAITAGTAGLPLAAPGVAITLANVTSGNGVTSGGIYTTTTTRDHQAGQLEQFSLSAIQYPAIT